LNGVEAALEYRIGYPLWQFVCIVMGDNPTRSAKSVPTFYPCDLDQSANYEVTLAAVVIAMIFGGIHCVAWSFQFSSHMEQLYWRLTSLFITCSPPLSWLVGAVILLFWRKLSYWWKKALEFVLGYIAVGGSVLYVLSRVTLLVITFVSLRSLPPGAYETVHLITFIPHIYSCS